MKLIGWKVWYCDAEGRISTFSSKQGSWDQAPQQNVQYVAQWWRKGEKVWKTVHGGCDVYVLDNVQAGAIASMFSCAKLGLEIDPDTLLDVMRRASEDQEEF